MRQPASRSARPLAVALAVLCLLAGGWGSVRAQVVDVQWNPNAEPDLDGYRLYAHTDPNTYSLDPNQARAVAFTVNVDSSTTSYTFTGLTTGVTWYFSITALDVSGNESGFPVNTSTPPYVFAIPSVTPVVRSLSPSSATQGDSNLNVTISGSNFDVGSTVDMGPGITVNSVNDSGAPTRLVANVSVAQLAQASYRDIMVTNPGGASASKQAAFRVDVNVDRVDLDSSGRIDNGDFLALLAGYPASIGDAVYSTANDFDVDGNVDGADLAFFFTYFGMTAPFP